MNSLEGKNVLLWSFSDRDSDELIDQFEENYGLNNIGSGPAGGGDDVIDLYAENFNFLGFPTFSVICTDKSITWDIWPLTAGAPEIETVLNSCGIQDAAAPYESVNPNAIGDLSLPTNQLAVYPNPVKETAQFNVELVSNADVTIEIYNVVGQQVQTVFAGQKAKGFHNFEANVADFQSGAYLAKMVIDGERVITEMFMKK